MMTRKDYTVIANALAEVIEDGKNDCADLYTARYAAARVATALGNAYANFDRDRFLAACGMQDPSLRSWEVL